MQKTSPRTRKQKENMKKEAIEDNVVVVLDNSNYKSSYAEKTPFKAKVFEKTENEIWVKSLKTGKTYELYPTQILECFDIDVIENMIDMSKYGLN